MLCAASLAACGPDPVRDRTTVPEAEVLPLLDATLIELLGRLETRAESLTSVNAITRMAPTAGSNYSGVIEEYHDVRAFVLAEREGNSRRHVRMLGQAPVVKRTVFDMVADEVGFRVSIPPKDKFLVGTNRVTHQSEKPIENLRPQHLFDAFLPNPPLPPGPLVLHFLEENEWDGRRYYAVTETTALESFGNGYGVWHVARKWWFDRTTLDLVRVQHFDSDGKLQTDIAYSDWRETGDSRYPYRVEISRPHDGYRLKLDIEQVTLNQPLGPERFRLEQPTGSELVDVDKLAEEELLKKIGGLP